MPRHARRGLPFGLFLGLGLLSPGAGRAQPADLAAWQKQPADLAATIAADKAELQAGTAPGWAWLRSPQEYEHVEVAATVTIRAPARVFGFFGSSWSAWPPRDWGDQGYDAALLLRGGKDSGYRVQLSHKYQDVALVKYPDGGYVRVVPCTIKTDQPLGLTASVHGMFIVIRCDGRELIRYRDASLALTKGQVGVGVSSGAKVAVANVAVRALPVPEITSPPLPHLPQFTARKWLGGRTWVFDGDEPILQLHSAQDPSCFAKLKPGYKPQITFDSHWGIENQGAFKEGASKWTEPTVAGGGKTLTASWSARNVGDHFATHSTLTVGYDRSRNAYTYDVESELEVLPGKPFTFRYGMDFEHHTPLDPFRWQYLVVRGAGGQLYHRPVTPVDPGVMDDLYANGGLRLWYGRHLETLHVAPAVEYTIDAPGPRKLQSAVCAAFYDTGIAFAHETANPGTRVRVKYRYTGYPAAEAKALFERSVIYPSRMLDPEHHYIFAGSWPRVTFDHFEPMSKTWIYGRRPFMTGHNTRPTYELARDTGVGAGFAMRLGPASYGKADLPLPGPLAAGRYTVVAQSRSDNAIGPGGRIEVIATEAKTNKVLSRAVHHLGNGSFGWKKDGFVFDVPAGTAGLALGLGNAGTGVVDVAEVAFQRLDGGAALPDGVLVQPRPAPPAEPAPAGALADYRMSEQKGLFVYDHAAGPLGLLELANVGWTVDDGRPALRFADNPAGQKHYPRGRNLDVTYLSHPGYKDAQTVVTAIAGTHGGGIELKALTLAAWIKPAAAMGKSTHGGFGDLVGFGARRFILRLAGQTAPYHLAASFNNAETMTSRAELSADRWYHVALTAEPTAEKKWRVRLYLDGTAVHDEVTHKLTAPLSPPPSLVLGAELFYLHHAYYRGLIGRTLVLGRALDAAEVAALAKR